MADADSSSATYESDFIGDSEDESRGSSKKRKRLRRLLRRVKANVVIPQTDVVSTSDGEEPVGAKKIAAEVGGDVQKGEEGAVPSAPAEPAEEEIGGTRDPSVAHEEETVGPVPEEKTTAAEDNSVGSLSEMALSQAPPPSQQTSGSQRSSEDNGIYLGGKLLDLSLELTSVLEKARLEDVAANSDDSLKEEEPPGRERDVTPFDLSGSMLLADERVEVSQDPSPLSGLSGPTGVPPQEEGEWSSAPSGTPPVPETLTVRGSTTITPRTKPPSFRQVKATLKEFAIPETVAQVPFYSDASDISRRMEVGERMLRVENYSIAALRAHVSDLELVGTEERRERALNYGKKGGQSIRPALVGKRDTHITPLLKPPTWQEACRWSQGEAEEVGEQEERTKTKVRMPKSPGQESDEEMDLSLTLTSPGAAARSGPGTPEDTSVPGPSGLGRVSLDDSSASTSPSTFPEDVRHSTPCRPPSRSPSPLGCRKGPAHRVKGVKRLSLMKKLQTIEEEQRLGGLEEAETSRRELEERRTGSDSSFGIRGVTLDNTYGFKSSVECLQNAKAVQAHEYVTTLIMELHVQTRGTFRPDPQCDPIRAVFYTLVTDAPNQVRQTGVLAVGEGVLNGTAAPPLSIDYLPDEKALLDKVMEYVRIWDPDILAGYEIEMQSWGYLFQRGFVLEKNLFSAAGRVVNDGSWKELSDGSNESDFDDIPRYLRQMRVPGRIVLDIWRLLRHEVALTSYTFESVTYHLLHARLPKHSHQALSHFWEHPTRRYRHITVEYYKARTEGVARLLDHLDFVSRNSELARLFGIQFYEVLSRGSQFRVESMMLRLAKPLNYVPCSPSIRQRASMRAPASLPLIMEPESMFYADPIVVLDFQSLYPSMIIAYNYCFSTCLGRVELLGGREPFEFGCTHLQVSPEEVKKLESDIHISPAGIAFVRPNVRKGVLPSMLEEILETRLMVKKSMKENRQNKVLQKVLHARQLGLKLIANVTYGYTAANFSGRMPSIEVGDSVVSKGRETLQRAIEMVKGNAEWGAKVVYGDTDSLFVLIPGRTREEAFRIGGEIAEAVTRDNPKPVKLKLEKVYQPSILQTKKRYVGYMYETPDQERPVYDAKGIETVRRDGCPATGKILQKALQILFETKDVSLVKKYTVRQFAKLFQGRVNLQDLIFAREYRGRRGYRPGACVPALELAKRWTQVDRRAEPRVKERVPYVIVNGPPGLPLIRLVRSPQDLLTDPTLRINAVYYITKAIIPPMQRCFSLLGADVLSWYAEMPRKYHRAVKSTHQLEGQRRATISQFFATVECAVCSKVTNSPVCADCQGDTQKVAVVLHDKIRRLERSYDGVMRICGSCCGRTTLTDCESLDCPVLYRRHGIARDFGQVDQLRQLSDAYLC